MASPLPVIVHKQLVAITKQSTPDFHQARKQKIQYSYHSTPTIEMIIANQIQRACLMMTSSDLQRRSCSRKTSRDTTWQLYFLAIAEAIIFRMERSKRGVLQQQLAHRVLDFFLAEAFYSISNGPRNHVAQKHSQRVIRNLWKQK